MNCVRVLPTLSPLTFCNGYETLTPHLLAYSWLPCKDLKLTFAVSVASFPSRRFTENIRSALYCRLIGSIADRTPRFVVTQRVRWARTAGRIPNLSATSSAITLACHSSLTNVCRAGVSIGSYAESTCPIRWRLCMRSMTETSNGSIESKSASSEVVSTYS